MAPSRQRLPLRPRLHGPDAGDRYYVLQLVDASTNNFAYIGRRATGTGEGRFLLVGPTDAPDGMQLVRSPSGVTMIGGRVQVNGAADAPDALTAKSPSSPRRALQSEPATSSWSL